MNTSEKMSIDSIQAPTLTASTQIESMVSQLSECLKFKSIRGDKNDCILYKITPRNVTNFRHLLSCDTIVRLWS